MNNKHKGLIAVATTVALLAGGLGIATISNAEPTPTPTTADKRGPDRAAERVKMDATLAEKLGITSEKVAEIFSANRGDRTALVKALADASGKDATAVTAILDEIRPPRYLDRVPAVAKALGLDEAKVKEIFATNRGGHDAVTKALVTASGKDESTVIDVLKSNRPGRGLGDGTGDQGRKAGERGKANGLGNGAKGPRR